MVDSARDDANLIKEDDNGYDYRETVTTGGSQTQFLGMAPVQRFVVAFMIFMMVCILGSFFLLITESVWLPL